ncbi:MAG TPA: CHAD domain-containing protein [Gaiellaceae bacterium]|nr:CHAD domain-containing protein [Gaiellaceae bacterium]
MNPEHVSPDGHAVRDRAYAISQGPDAGTPDENWRRAEREFAVVHEYDTADRDLEQLGMTVARIPLEAGALWRLDLPRGERIEAWEPGNAGLRPPPEIMSLIGGVVAGKPLVPAPPVSADPGAARLREMLLAQRQEMLVHEPGVRLGTDIENLHEHRVAARRTRAFVRAARDYVDPDWRREIADPLGDLGDVTGPVRDLDVLLDHIRTELDTLGEPDPLGATTLVERLENERGDARLKLVDMLDDVAYRRVLGRMRVPPRLAAGVESVPLEKIARKEFRRLAKGVERLGGKPDNGAIHRLRIALKRARYASELSAPQGKRGRGFLADAKVLQTLLGEHQDAAVAEVRLRATTVFDAATSAAFVAGRLAERQRLRRERVLEQLPATWKRLRKSAARLGH